MSAPQASTAPGKKRLLQLLILTAAITTSIIIAFFPLIEPKIRIIIITVEALSGIVLYFVIGKVIK
jgi:hypothetical protein